MIKHRAILRKAEKGQSFVELGLSMVFLLILLAAVIDLGWAFFTLVALRDAAQEAATVGAICPPSSTANEDKIRERLMSSATAPIDMSKLSSSQIDICVIDPIARTCGAAVELGKSVRVTITYQHEIVTPLVGSFIGGQNYPLVASAADTILRLNCDAIP